MVALIEQDRLDRPIEESLERLTQTATAIPSTNPIHYDNDGQVNWDRMHQDHLSYLVKHATASRTYVHEPLTDTDTNYDPKQSKAGGFLDKIFSSAQELFRKTAPLIIGGASLAAPADFTQRPLEQILAINQQSTNDYHASLEEVSQDLPGFSDLLAHQLPSNAQIELIYGPTPPNETTVVLADGTITMEIVTEGAYVPRLPGNTVIGIEPGGSYLVTSHVNGVVQIQNKVAKPLQILTPVPTPTPTPQPELPAYTCEEVQYFGEIGFGGENNKNFTRLFGWEDSIRLYVDGNPTQKHLERVDITLNYLQRNGVDIQYTQNTDEANMIAYINVDHSDFYDIFPEKDRKWLDANGGVVDFDVKEDPYTFKSARIGVANNSILSGFNYSQQFIEHLIMEEIIQAATGLHNDSPSHINSIFYDDPNNKPHTLLTIDERMIQLKSLDSIRPGMTYDEVPNVIRVTDIPCNIN